MRKQKRKRGGNRRHLQPQTQATQAKAEPLVEVLIERLLPGGAGLAHAGGRTILVGLAAPGDRALVQIERVQGRVAFASIKEILSPAPERVEPPCPYFGRCGGCDFQQLSYQAQLTAKAGFVRDCLRRIARVEFPGEIPITASPVAWRYRSRAQWQHDPQRKLLGYFERGSHNVCDVAECPVLVPELQKALEGLRARMQSHDLPAGMTEFQAVAGDEGASLTPPLPGSSTLEVSRLIAGHRYRFSAEGFFQINQELLPSLVTAAIGDARGETAVDLYCGAGLFTLPLAGRFERVRGVEAHPAAIAYARRNLADAQLDNVAFECARVGDWLSANSAALAPVDFLLLDPPRAGAEEEAVRGILALRPRHISYVSCDPATLARDLKGLTGGGYTLTSIRAFDMFPQTHHVETVAHLSLAAL
ncbi:MAG TPA: class I SAM-dependent RNA methyltransferase [Pyrinomonadaceae bacterium]|jgi:23S rRNA (uracil1939-C5)-methyltransferase